MAKLFIVEDDKGIREELTRLLSAYGHQCEWTENFQEAIQDILKATPDLVLLDVNLPFCDGYYICRELRAQSSVPIIIVTSRNSDMDELMSMNLGADDFITKPYNTQILLAHINAVLKRSQAVQADTQVYKNITFNRSNGTLNYNDQTLELTKNEQRIIGLLMQHQGKIVTREEIMQALWQSDEFIDDNTLTVNMTRLRRKLAEVGLTEFLMTKRGQGYMI